MLPLTFESSYNSDRTKKEGKKEANCCPGTDDVCSYSKKIQGCNDSRKHQNELISTGSTPSLDSLGQGATRQGTSLGFVQRGQFRFVHRQGVELD